MSWRKRLADWIYPPPPSDEAEWLDFAKWLQGLAAVRRTKASQSDSQTLRVGLLREAAVLDVAAAEALRDGPTPPVEPLDRPPGG